MPKTMLNIDVMTNLCYHGKRIDEPQKNNLFSEVFCSELKSDLLCLLHIRKE